MLEFSGFSFLPFDSVKDKTTATLKMQEFSLDSFTKRMCLFLNRSLQ